ncbi:MAG: GtrA family protein [Corynebacterium glucuronolyticum]|uniref:GtrA family protein n=1 Tax=uncultured Corynebacterium sp. TaxID=159447 RepID=UPI002631E7D9|nr:GtrA family protein [uncultured Corynebacterium sp.]MCI6206141.1 GtrA family protein [Corynebacterium glucuronolyticum]MDD7587342.1 GtrA family protein [Mycobacteriaceae bacterium]MDY5833297.1 GtrA family protein [Corynebacterium glucuronolyticum]
MDSLGKQGYRFIVSGCISAVFDIGLTYLFQFGFGWAPFYARTVGFIVGTLVAYMINRRWTFGMGASTKRFVQVWLLYGMSYFLNTLIYDYGFHFLDNFVNQYVAATAAFVVAQGVATVINFFVQRWFIFNKNRNGNS